jgi:hypothetical protein
MIRRLPYLALLIPISLGCTQRLGDLTVATNKNVVLSTFDPRADEAVSAEGKDCKHIIIFIPTGIPNIEAAIDRALADADRNFMTDVVMTRKSWYIPLIYGQDCMRITGSAWRLETALGPDNANEDTTGVFGVTLALTDGRQLSGYITAASWTKYAIREADTREIHWVSRAEIESYAPLTEEQ